MNAAELVFEVVRTIPHGRVVTYGQVRDLVTAMRLTALQVGRFMAQAPPDVPWQRVVGAGGALPIAKRAPEWAARQRELLENEGIEFLPSGSIDMRRFGWLNELSAGPSLFDLEGEE